MAGQNNHFLITILVGLAAVEKGTATLPPEMHTTWEPRDGIRSAARSREFAIKAMLAWLIDAIDTYIRLLAQQPVVADEKLLAAIKAASDKEEGLSGKVRRISTAINQEGSPEVALVEMAIMWRNRLVHMMASSRISKPLARAARSHSAYFAENYQGLVIDDFIEHAQQKPTVAPSLKEVTAIVRATHKFVERIDEHLLARLDLEKYFTEVLGQYLTENIEVDPASAASRASNVWSRSPERRRSTIVQIALNSGFSNYRDSATNELSQEAIDRFANLTPREAIAKLAP